MNIRGLYIDVETGGFDPSHHALLSVCITEFRLYPYDTPSMDAMVYRQIAPDPGLDVCKSALEVQKIGWASLEDSRRVSEKEAIASLSLWLGEDERMRLPIWAHEAVFDRNFLSAAIRRQYPNGSDAPIAKLAGRDARWSCSRNLAELAVFLGKMECPQKEDGTRTVSLDYLLLALGLPSRKGGRHSADEDVRLGILATDALLRRLGHLPKMEILR